MRAQREKGVMKLGEVISEVEPEVGHEQMAGLARLHL